MREQVPYNGERGKRVRVVTVLIVMTLAASCFSNFTSAQGIVWIKDGYNLPEHRLRGQEKANADLEAGRLKFYVPICTFPRTDQRDLRRFEIRKPLMNAAHITVMADLCNDVIPNASQQAAFVAGYKVVMDAAIARQLGNGWKALQDKQVEAQRRKRPKGKLRAGDIQFETPY